jgi:hypothetical protein
MRGFINDTLHPISRIRWEWHVECMREKRNIYKVLMGKPERKGPLRRLRCRWEDNITI